MTNIRIKVAVITVIAVIIERFHVLKLGKLGQHEDSEFFNQKFVRMHTEQDIIGILGAVNVRKSISVMKHATWPIQLKSLRGQVLPYHSCSSKLKHLLFCLWLESRWNVAHLWWHLGRKIIKSGPLFSKTKNPIIKTSNWFLNPLPLNPFFYRKKLCSVSNKMGLRYLCCTAALCMHCSNES